MNHIQENTLRVLYKFQQNIDQIKKLQVTALSNLNLELEYADSNDIDLNTLDDTLTIMIDCYRRDDPDIVHTIISHEVSRFSRYDRNVFYLCLNLLWVEKFLQDVQLMGISGSVLANGRIDDVELYSHPKMLVMIEKIEKLLELIDVKI